MTRFNLLPVPQVMGWDTFTHSHMSVLKLFLLYALPLSLVSPLMIYYAGIMHGSNRYTL